MDYLEQILLVPIHRIIVTQACNVKLVSALVVVHVPVPVQRTAEEVVRVVHVEVGAAEAEVAIVVDVAEVVEGAEAAAEAEGAAEEVEVVEVLFKNIS